MCSDLSISLGSSRLCSSRSRRGVLIFGSHAMTVCLYRIARASPRTAFHRTEQRGTQAHKHTHARTAHHHQLCACVRAPHSFAFILGQVRFCIRFCGRMRAFAGPAYFILTARSRPAFIQFPPAPQHFALGPAGPAGVPSRCSPLVQTSSRVV